MSRELRGIPEEAFKKFLNSLGRIRKVRRLETPLPLKYEEYVDTNGVDPSIYSLLYTVYRLYKPSGPEELMEETHRYLDRLSRWIDTRGPIHTETDPKKAALLILPSDRQFEKVRRDWRGWLWRSRTNTGEITPTGEGWMKDILRIADALRNEGVEPIIAVDKGIYHEVSQVYSGRLIEVDIPENLPKTGYARDQSLTWWREPIIGLMALHLRKGEEDILIRIYRELGLDPIYAVSPEEVWGRVYMPHVEGGNYIVVDMDGETTIFTGVGVRGTNPPAFKSLSRILPRETRFIGVPISAYINDWETGAVHLDVVMMYIELDGGTFLIDPSRMGLYSFLEYDRERGEFRIHNGVELLTEKGYNLVEPPRKGASKITMVNAFNLGGNKILVDSYNRETNRYLEKLGADVIEVDIPHIEAGGGGIRCATKELWI